jgi:hypothetical protein
MIYGTSYPAIIFTLEVIPVNWANVPVASIQSALRA